MPRSLPTRILSSLAALMVLAGCQSQPSDPFALDGLDSEPIAQSITVDPADTAAPEEAIPFAGLRDLARARGFNIGVAVDFKALQNPTYTRILKEEFGSITSENEMKWETMQPIRGQFEWFFADTLVALAKENDQAVRGHTLVWHSQLPAWVRNIQTKDDLYSVMDNHIKTIVTRYRGKVHRWDVVNEVINDTDGKLRDSVFSRLSGEEFIARSFRLAHEADPDALLFINDYSIEWMGTKSDAIYNLVKKLLDQGVPIHGVGFQTHWQLDIMPDFNSVRRNIQRFADLGLLVDLTEVDIRIRQPASAADIRKQAEWYGRIFSLPMEFPDTVKSITVWGLSDGHSWIPNWQPAFGAALILDRQYRPKPAYAAIKDVLAK